MATVLARFDVEDFERWRTTFDERSEQRREHGWQGGRLFTVRDKPGKVIVLMEWESADAAVEFYESGESRRLLQDAGVKRKPDLTPLDHVEDFDASPLEDGETAAGEDDTPTGDDGEE